LAALFVWRGGLSMSDRIVQTAGFSMLALFFAAVLVRVVAAAPSSPAGRLFGHPAARLLGRYSYAMYVFHMMLRPTIESHLPPSRIAAWTGSSVLGMVLFLAIAVGTCLTAAWVSWHLYEKHFLKLKRYFEYGS
jgi:peptidoglycan/LPS O-acetylase OafA/YrhL